LAVLLRPLPAQGPLALAFAPTRGLAPSRPLQGSRAAAEDAEAGAAAAGAVEARHEACALVALGFLAAQPSVDRVEVAPRMQIHGQANKANQRAEATEADKVDHPTGIPTGSSEDSSTGSSTGRGQARRAAAGGKDAAIGQRIAALAAASTHDSVPPVWALPVSRDANQAAGAEQARPARPRRLNYLAKSAVQAAGDNDPTPFTSLNVTGNGQYVQVLYFKKS
jgi:hypothetical protein